MPQAQSGMDASNRLKRAVPQLRRRGNPTPRKKSSGSNNQAQMHMNQISQTNVLQQPQIAENDGQEPTGQGDFKIHLDVTKEDSSKKTFDLNFRPTCSVLNVKLDVLTFTNIPVSRQKWSGWPEGITDDLTLAEIGIKREHHMSLSIASRHTGRDMPNIDIDMEASTFGFSSRSPTSVASASSKKLENM